MEHDVLRQEVQRLLDLLRSQADQERLAAAAQLHELGVRTRGAVRTRGSATQPATKPIAGLDLSPALAALADARWEVRREVALALGEWGDELAIAVLSHLARSEPEWRVRVAVAASLANVGGSQGVERLKGMAYQDPHEEVRASAVEGLGRLALTTWPALEDHVRTRGPIRTRGQIRVRGASPSKRVSPEADAILALLDQIRASDISAHVRDAADHTLASLDE